MQTMDSKHLHGISQNLLVNRGNLESKMTERKLKKVYLERQSLTGVKGWVFAMNARAKITEPKIVLLSRQDWKNGRETTTGNVKENLPQQPRPLRQML